MSLSNRSPGAPAVFVRLASRPIPRVTRMMQVARDRGVRPLFLGAFREQGLMSSDSWDGFDVSRIGSPLPLLNGRGLLKYVAGVARFNAALLKELRRRGPCIVHASDVETSPASIAHRYISQTPLILNIHDNLADRYTIPVPVRAVLNAIEGLAVRMSDVALVPEEFRRQALPRWCRKRVVVVRNSPQDIGAAPPDLSPGRRVRILYAGWLDWGRGLAALLKLADDHPWLDVQIAGEGTDDIVSAIAGSRATFLGFIGHREILAETHRAHFVAAFYDPVRPINRAAAPNKLAEAFSAGRPVLINEETIVAQAPELAECTLRVRYGDWDGLAERIRAIAIDGSGRYDQMCRAARRVYEEQYAWDGIRSRVDDIYDDLGVRRGCSKEADIP